MIQSDEELRYSIETVARMYRLRDREATEPLWDPEWRSEMAEDTGRTIQKIQREIAEYLARKYELLPSAAASEANKAA